MEKKTYSKPILMAERFEPQEYCGTCESTSGLLSNLSSGARYFYIDFNSKNGICDGNPQEFVTKDSGKTSYGAYKNQHYSDIPVYCLADENYNIITNSVFTNTNPEITASAHSYGSLVTYSGKKYRFLPLGTYDIYINDKGKVYYNNHS